MIHIDNIGLEVMAGCIWARRMIEGVQESHCHVCECCAAAAIKAFMMAISPSWQGKVEPPHYRYLTGIEAGENLHHLWATHDPFSHLSVTATPQPKGEMKEEIKKQRLYSIHTLLWVLPLNPHEWEAVEKATGFVIAGNRKINFSTSEVWGSFCQGIAPWQSTSEWWFAGFFFVCVSLFQHLLERYVENLFINRAEGKNT